MIANHNISSVFKIRNKQMNSYHFEYCPKCGVYHPDLVKAGKTKAGKQMFKCNACHKRFVCDHGQLTFYLHQSQVKWNDLIIETQNGKSILKTTAKINVNESTAFRMPHKYLHFIEVMEYPIQACKRD